MSVPNVPSSLASDPRVDVMNMTVLPSGQVLVTGAGGSHVFLYTPDGGPLEAWKPAVVSIAPISPGSTTSWVSGWGLNGISEGGVFGDDNSTSSNYPLVQLTDRFGHVTYATTSNWTTTQVGDNFEGFQFTPPANLPYGEYTLRVIASGIASDPVAYHNGLNPSGQGLTSGAVYELVPEDNQGVALTSVGGGKVGTSPSNGLASQRWEVLDAGNGLFTIIPTNAPRKVLGAADALGQPVTVGKADGSAVQKWTITPSGDGFYDLSPQSNPLATLGDGSLASLVVDTDAISQRWMLVPVNTIANGLYRLSPWNRPGKALAVQGSCASWPHPGILDAMARACRSGVGSHERRRRFCHARALELTRLTPRSPPRLVQPRCDHRNRPGRRRLKLAGMAGELERGRLISPCPRFGRRALTGFPGDRAASDDAHPGQRQQQVANPGMELAAARRRRSTEGTHTAKRPTGQANQPGQARSIWLARENEAPATTWWVRCWIPQSILS